MRGTKRRAAAVSAAEKPQPVVNDGILDVVTKKGIRCCVECGATSTPQWREGPMGPKTLCNACGVRRQRLLRKQQAISVGTAPTAPVAAVQARRRLAGRDSLQWSLPAMGDDEPHLAGHASGSEHSSDETELDWASHQAAAPCPATQAQPAPAQREPQQPQHSEPPVQNHPQELDDSCNEEESAAYDLLFFAGIECGGGSFGASTAGNTDCADREGNGSGVWRRSCLPGHPHSSQFQQHGHFTRRHVHPVRRSDDFYYYDGEGDVAEEASAGSFGADGAGGGKRRRMTASPALLRVQSRMAPRAPSVSVSEDAAESMPGAATTPTTRNGRPASLLFSSLPKPQLETHCSDVPAAPAASGATVAGADKTSLHHIHNPAVAAQSASSPALPAAAMLAPSPSAPASSAAAMAVPPLSLPSLSPLAPLAPLLTLPVALPVLPLSVSLPLPSMSAKDLEVIAKLQWDFQKACMQLQRANAACEAVGVVVAERREAAISAHEAAVAASQQLANGARSVADQYKLRDVLAELRGATSVPAPAAAVGGGSEAMTGATAGQAVAPTTEAAPLAAITPPGEVPEVSAGAPAAAIPTAADSKMQ